MNRIASRITLGVAFGFLSLVPSTASAQTTFTACRVPDVGAIYMIGVTGAPSACLDASHIEFSWTEGGAPGANSVTSAMIVDGEVSTDDIADGTITAADFATDAVDGAAIAPDAVGSTEILDASIQAVDLAPGVRGFTTTTVRGTSPGVTLTAGTSTFVGIQCEAGETVMGGGAVNQNAPGVYIKQSYPISNGWNVTYENTTVTDRTGFAYAICAS